MSDLLYVLAGTYEHARDYAYRNHRAHYSRVVNVDRTDKLRGIRGLTLYVTPTAVKRKNYAELIQMAEERQMVIKRV